MTVYQTPTGVKIGLLYKQPMPTMCRDSLRLQEALLDPRTKNPRPLLMRILGRLVAWL